MTNLQLANTALENLKVSFELETAMEKVPELYLEKLQNKLEEEGETAEIFEELVELDEVDNFHGYIVHNLREQLEGVTNINERYETIAIVVWLSN